MDKFISWIQEHITIVTSVVVPIIIAIIGLFSYKTLVKKDNNQKIEQNNNTASNSDGSFNPANQNAGNHSLLLASNATLNLTINHFDTHMKNANNIKTANTIQFRTILNEQFEELNLDDSIDQEKLSTPSVQTDLENAATSAGQTNSRDIHQLLGQLIKNRLKRDQENIVDLSVSEAIRITSKLDENLIKILAFNFFFRSTKNMGLNSEFSFFDIIERATKQFKNITLSKAKLQYLESISCGSVQELIAPPKLSTILWTRYPQLFTKPLSKEVLNSLIGIPVALEAVLSNPENPRLHPAVGLVIYEDLKIPNLHEPSKEIKYSEAVKNQLKNVYENNRQNEIEFSVSICEKNADFKILEALWHQENLGGFQLNTTGICIARAYLEQNGFEGYKLETWIN